MSVLFNRISDFVDQFQKEYSVLQEFRKGIVTITLSKNNKKWSKQFAQIEIEQSKENILLNWFNGVEK